MLNYRILTWHRNAMRSLAIAECGYEVVQRRWISWFPRPGFCGHNSTEKFSEIYITLASTIFESPSTYPVLEPIRYMCVSLLGTWEETGSLISCQFIETTLWQVPMTGLGINHFQSTDLIEALIFKLVIYLMWRSSIGRSQHGIIGRASKSFSAKNRLCFIKKPSLLHESLSAKGHLCRIKVTPQKAISPHQSLSAKGHSGFIKVSLWNAILASSRYSTKAFYHFLILIHSAAPPVKKTSKRSSSLILPLLCLFITS